MSRHRLSLAYWVSSKPVRGRWHLRDGARGQPLALHAWAYMCACTHTHVIWEEKGHCTEGNQEELAEGDI